MLPTTLQLPTLIVGSGNHIYHIWIEGLFMNCLALKELSIPMQPMEIELELIILNLYF